MTLRRPPTFCRYIATWLAALSCLAAHPAHATPNFPAAIESYLKLTYVPACTICHATSAGGEGTVTKPFGMNMQAAGLEAYDVPSLDVALQKLEADDTSSAGDGVSDITKLQEGLDPNVSENGSFGPTEPAFGCGAQIAPVAIPGTSVAPFLALVAGVGLVQRRRMRRWRAHDKRPDA